MVELHDRNPPCFNVSFLVRFSSQPQGQQLVSIEIMSAPCTGFAVGSTETDKEGFGHWDGWVVGILSLVLGSIFGFNEFLIVLIGIVDSWVIPSDFPHQTEGWADP